jgi:DinB superfamily
LLALAKLSRRMERQQAALLEGLASWTPEQLSFQPSPDRWSATQVIDHLLKVERGTTDHLRETLAHPGAPIASADVQRAHSLIRWLLSDEQAKVPRSAAAAIWPDDELRLHEITEQWRRARRDLLDLVCDREPDERAVFTHPGSGPMNLVLVMRYLYAHTRHHEHQLSRLQQAMRGHPL